MDLNHMPLWFPAYAKNRVRQFARVSTPRRLWVTLADHYEPLGGGVSFDVASRRVAAWEERWPGIAHSAPKDATGNTPCYTFFYPQEEYQRDLLERIASLARTGVVDVEVHIHHDHDTADSFRIKIRNFCQHLYEEHGLLRMHNGKLSFGFIHGNWALDNSRPDGRWCGVTGEIQLLHELGCYADMTMPSVPSLTQSRIVNEIYWAAGDPSKPRAFDHAIPAIEGGGLEDTLLMVPGPLGFRYRDRLLPRVETGELAIYDAPTPYRIERWIDLAPRIGDDVFLKLYSHAAREDNAGALLGSGTSSGTLGSMFHWLYEAAEKRNMQIMWASAYRMYQAIEEILTRTKANTVPAEALVEAQTG